MERAAAHDIEVRGLVRTFTSKRQTVRAVRDVSFAVSSGERIACIGPNGAGKSTTIKMLTGILKPSGGEVSVLGLVPWKQRKQLAHRIGVLFGQRSQLWQELPARRSLELLGAVYRIDRAQVAERIDELGELLDATDLLDEPVRNLSLGQRMRCELAASLLHEPGLLFLDEPTIGLDLVAKQRFRNLLVDLNKAHDTTVLLTSHDIADVEIVAERVIVINHGQVRADAPTSSFRPQLEEAITNLYEASDAG